MKIFLPGQTFVGGGPALVTACLEEVGSDFVVITRIAVNGTPIIDPRRLTLRETEIVGIERLNDREQLLEFLVQLC